MSSDNSTDIQIKELEAQKQALDQRIREIRKAKRKQAIQQAQAIINEYEIRLSELRFQHVTGAPGGRKRKAESKPRAHYKNPATGEIYQGRGRPPQWWKDAKTAGTLERLIVR